MPRKYIKIRQLHARVPFRQCVIQFVVRRRQRDPLLSSEIEFYAKAISYCLDENIELIYSQKHLNSLAVYLVAINSENRVASIGFVPLRLAETCTDRKEKMQGLNEQTGFIVYSMQDEPFASMSHLVNVKIEASSNSANSEDAEKKSIGRLDVKKSEFADEEAEEGRKEVKAGYRGEEESGRTLQRSRQDGTLPTLAALTPLTSEQPIVKDTSKLTPPPVLIPNSPQDLIPKSSLAEELGFADQPSPLYLPSLQNTANKPSLASEHEQLQSFIIDVLRHKLRNSQHFLSIKRNADFLEQQRLRFAQMAQRTAQN